MLLLLCAMIRYLSFYFLAFRSEGIEHSRSYKLHIGAERFSSKVFYKIDFQVPARLEWLRKISNTALYISFAGIATIVLLIILQKII